MDEKRYNNGENSNDDINISIDDDYLELLSRYKDDSGYEDIFSNSSDSDDEPDDIFSYSSDDVYIGKKKKDNGDIYIGSGRRVPNRVAKADTGELPPVKKPNANPAPPPIKKAKPSNDDEISDYEARRGGMGTGKKKPVGIVIVALLLALIVGLGGILFVTANSIVGKFTKAEEIEHIEDVDSLVSDSSVRNILLIGSDARSSDASARSDTIMIVSVNKTTGKITMCSILRDTHLDIPGYREAKVNSAYYRGGANLLVQTIEQNFGIKIDDYAAVDFEMFTALVDGLGGIEVEVTENEADYINNRHKYGKEEKPDHFESGESVHLNGYQALWYARIRKLDSDFMRTERQRKVMSAIFEKVKTQLNPAGVFGLISTAKEVAPFIETTLSTIDFWSLVTSLVACFAKSGGDMDKLLVSQKIPFDDTWHYASKWDGSSIVIDVEENKQLLYELLYEEQEEETTEDTE